MKMKKIRLKLQLFAEGGGAESTSTSSGADTSGIEGNVAENESEVATPKKSTKSKGLEKVVYGKVADGDETANSSVETPKTFEEMIKKGGEFHEEFSKKTQAIINERFKETKTLQESLEKQSPILSMLADKYGVDATDLDALTRAIEDDESFYQQEALERGLSVEQLKEFKALQRENETFKKAEEEAERKANSERIYAEWMEQGEKLAQKYNLQNFDLEEEVNNPAFTKLLANGIDVESAYKAIHFDEMLGGAMATTANNVREGLAQSIAARQARPSENGVSPQSGKIFKTDVKALSKADRAEVARRARAGESISF